MCLQASRLMYVLSCAAGYVLSCSCLQAQSVSPNLITSATITGLPDGRYQAVVTIMNSGSASATNVYLTAAALANTEGSLSPVPLADIPAGGQVATTVFFGSDSGTPGSLVIERFTGVYNGGSFGGSLRTTLPEGAATPTVTAVVDTTHPGAPIPDHFMGFSMDTNVTSSYVGSGPVADPILVNLLNNFTPYNGVPSLRPAASPASSGSPNISAKFLHALTTLETATSAPLLVTIGLGRYDPTYAHNVASSVTAALGNTPNLQFELGNEPDQLARQGYRPSTYGFPDYVQEFNGYAAAVAASTSGKYAAGMASGSATWDTANDAAFLNDAAGVLGTVTSHEYPLSACQGTSSITIAHLLSDNISNVFYRRYQPIVQAASAYGIPVRAGEMNSVSCSGFVGVSDVFASSLWVLDSLFELQLSGAAGMNLHTGSPSSGVPDQPYNAFYVNDAQVQVRPVYYGMLLFAEATQNHASQLPVTTTVTSAQNVKVWATLDSERVARIAIIEKDTTEGTQTVSIKLGASGIAAGSVGRLQTLSSAGLAATDQTVIQGQTFDGTTDGRLVGSAITTSTQPVAGVYTLAVPNGSAALLTVPLAPAQR